MLRFHILHIFPDYTIFFNSEINEYFLFFLFYFLGWGWGVAVEVILEDFISEIRGLVKNN